MPRMPCLTQDTHTHAPPTSLPLGHTRAPDPSTRITARAETTVHTGLSSAVYPPWWTPDKCAQCFRPPPTLCTEMPNEWFQKEWRSSNPAPLYKHSSNVKHAKIIRKNVMFTAVIYVMSRIIHTTNASFLTGWHLVCHSATQQPVGFCKNGPSVLLPVSIPLFSVTVQHLPSRGGQYFFVLEADLGNCFGQLSVAELTLFPFQAWASGVLGCVFFAPFLWNAHPAMWKVPSSLLEDEIHTVKSPLSPKGTCNTQKQTV